MLEEDFILRGLEYLKCISWCAVSGGILTPRPREWQCDVHSVWVMPDEPSEAVLGICIGFGSWYALWQSHNLAQCVGCVRNSSSSEASASSTPAAPWHVVDVCYLCGIQLCRIYAAASRVSSSLLLRCCIQDCPELGFPPFHRSDRWTSPE